MIPFKDYVTTLKDGVTKVFKTVIVGGSNVQDYGFVTPSDTVNLSKQAIGFVVTGVTGNVSLVKPDGTSITLPSSMISVGQIIPLPFKRVNATGTTATTILAVY